MADAIAAARKRAGDGAVLRAPALRFLRNVLILLSGGLVLLYAAALVYLYASQRDLLFPRATAPIAAPGPSSIYRVRNIVEPDGTRLTIWQAPAKRRGAGTFVMFHGNAASVLEFADAGEALHDKGFGIVLSSYRGYSGNTGTPSEQGLMADARAVLATVRKSDGPVILWGHSLGTGVAARMASEGRASALILESPFTSAVDVAAEAYPYFPVRLLMKDRFDTLSVVPRIKVPVLILHGTEDHAIPFEMSRTLARALGKQASLISIRGADHNPDPSDLLPFVTIWLSAHSAAIHRSETTGPHP